MVKREYFITFLLVITFVFSSGYSAFAEAGNVSKKCDYWDNGNAKMIKEYDQSNNLVMVSYCRENGTIEQLIKYDNRGHKVAEGNYNSDGKLAENADGWAAMRWKYVNGNMVGEGYYGDGGRLKEHKRYNDLGDLVARKYVGDSEPDPSEEYNPAPSLAGESESFYDSYGRPEGATSIEHYDDWFPLWWNRDD